MPPPESTLNLTFSQYFITLVQGPSIITQVEDTNAFQKMSLSLDTGIAVTVDHEAIVISWHIPGVAALLDSPGTGLYTTRRTRVMALNQPTTPDVLNVERASLLPCFFPPRSAIVIFFKRHLEWALQIIILSHLVPHSVSFTGTQTVPHNHKSQDICPLTISSVFFLTSWDQYAIKIECQGLMTSFYSDW